MTRRSRTALAALTLTAVSFTAACSGDNNTSTAATTTTAKDPRPTGPLPAEPTPTGAGTTSNTPPEPTTTIAGEVLPTDLIATTIPAGDIAADTPTGRTWVLDTSADVEIELAKVANVFGVTGTAKVINDLTVIDGGATGTVALSDTASASWTFLPACSDDCAEFEDPTARALELLVALGGPATNLVTIEDEFSGTVTTISPLVVEGLTTDFYFSFSFSDSGALQVASGSFAVAVESVGMPLAPTDELEARLIGRQPDHSTTGEAYQGGDVTNEQPALLVQRSADGQVLLIPATRFTAGDNTYTVPATYTGLFADPFSLPE